MSSSKTSYVVPGSRIGIVGGGQLGQMLAASAQEMGYRVTVLDPDPECSASFVADQIVAAYDDSAALKELAAVSDVLTYEFENVSAATLEAAGGYLPQGTRALEICQDRLLEKAFLGEAEIPVAPYASVSDSVELEDAITRIGYPCVLKTTRGGYDGKGQVVLRSAEDLDQATPLLTVPCVLEGWIPFDKEISVIVAGDVAENYVAFPAGENIHRNNILATTMVPAPISEELLTRAEELALRIAAAIGLVGVMGVEMFVASEGSIVVNELAPRPHNSGHYTIEACDFSQFDAHIRAICGLPVSQPRLLSPAVMTNILGEDLEDALQSFPEVPEWHLHLYGKKDARHGRKMGHVTELLAMTPRN